MKVVGMAYPVAKILPLAAKEVVVAFFRSKKKNKKERKEEEDKVTYSIRKRYLEHNEG